MSVGLTEGCPLWLLLALACAAGCDELEVDPPPRASPREIAIAPPGALGARPAGTSIDPPPLPEQQPDQASPEQGPFVPDEPLVPEPPGTGSAAPPPPAQVPL